MCVVSLCTRGALDRWSRGGSTAALADIGDTVPTLEETRADFEFRSKRALSMPMAGAIVWAVIGVLGLVLPQRLAIFALLFGTGAIFPIAMAIASARGEQLITNTNPLAKLMGACVLMVNLLWALHIPLVLRAPVFVPLSVGIGLGLHWVVYSWITQSHVGYVHAISRTIAVLLAWWIFQGNVVTACATAVVAAYVYALYAMATRPIPAQKVVQDVA
jgi:hypothetical protein